MDSQEIEGRLRVLEAKEEIRNLLQEYRRTLDVRDMRAFSALFAANGTWAGASGEATGPEGIYAMLTGGTAGQPALAGRHAVAPDHRPVDHGRRRPRDGQSLWMHVRRGEATHRSCPRSAATRTSSSSRTGAGASCGAR